MKAGRKVKLNQYSTRAPGVRPSDLLTTNMKTYAIKLNIKESV